MWRGIMPMPTNAIAKERKHEMHGRVYSAVQLSCVLRGFVFSCLHLGFGPCPPGCAVLHSLLSYVFPVHEQCEPAGAVCLA